MQGCQLVESHKSAGSGPVRSPGSSPSKKPNKQKPNRKQANKQKAQPQPNQNKHNTEMRGRSQQWEFMHDDILWCHYENGP